MLRGYYINLDSRKDRRDHFEKLKKTFSFLAGIERMPAILNDDGPLGCCCSHIEALTLASSTDSPYVAVFEDDFCILNHDVFVRFIADFENIKNRKEWSAIVLTPRGTTVVEENHVLPNFKRIVDHQTATGYIVNRDVLPILIDVLKEARELQIQGIHKDISANDQYWKRLQVNYPFYYYKDVFAGQLAGWSNIEKRMVDYNDRFVKQYLY